MFIKRPLGAMISRSLFINHLSYSALEIQNNQNLKLHQITFHVLTQVLTQHFQQEMLSLPRSPLDQFENNFVLYLHTSCGVTGRLRGEVQGLCRKCLQQWVKSSRPINLKQLGSTGGSYYPTLQRY